MSPVALSSPDARLREPPPPSAAVGPPWLPWLQLGLSTTLAVLFVVLLQGLQQQGRSLHLLDQRLQALENNRALDRTTALEQQLRAAVERLQQLEQEQARNSQERLDRQALEQELQDLRRRNQALAVPRAGSVLPLQPLAPPSAGSGGGARPPAPGRPGGNEGF